MKINSYLLYAYLFFFSCEIFSGVVWIDNVADTPLHPIAQVGGHRYWVLSRLAHAIETLQMVYNLRPKRVQKALDTIRETVKFNHPLTSRLMKEQKKVAIVPVLRLWQILMCFRYLEDELLALDFLHLLENLLCLLANEEFEISPTRFQGLSSLPLESVKTVDCCCDYLTGKKRKFIKEYEKTELEHYLDIFHISLSYYFIGRLRFTIPKILSQIKNNLQFTDQIVKHLITCTQHGHDYVRRVFVDCLEKKDIAHLEYLWDAILTNRFCNDIPAMKNFVQTMIYLLLAIRWQKQIEANESQCMQDIGEVSQAVNSFSLEELLEGLDSLLSDDSLSSKQLLLLKNCEEQLHNNEEHDKDDFVFREIGIKKIRFSNLLSRRFYFIERFSMDLNRSYGQCLLRNKESDKKSVRIIGKNTDFNYRIIPLFMVWEDFVQLKFLNSQLFVENFSKEILVIIPDKKKSQLLSNYYTERHIVLDQIPEYFEQKTEDIPVYPFIAGRDTTDLYLFIEHFKPLTEPFDSRIKKVNLSMLNNLEYVTHVDIKGGLQNGSLVKQVEHFWQAIKQYKYLFDYKFILEFGCIVCDMYLHSFSQEMLDHLVVKYDKELLSKRVSVLTYQEVLKLVDSISDTLYDFQEKEGVVDNWYDIISKPFLFLQELFS